LQTALKTLLSALVGVLCLVCVWSCNTTDRLPNRLFHNLTARYNPYFLVNKRLDSINQVLYDSRKENYNRVLEVIPQTDTTSWKAFDEVLNKSVKQASIIHNRHDNSKLLDPSYVLVGRCRFYLRDFDNATNTYKYVNTKSLLDNVRQQALIELMRTYIQTKDMRSAGYALTALNKEYEQMAVIEKRAFLLIRGHYFRKQDNYIETGKGREEGACLFYAGANLPKTWEGRTSL
jgi:hypothetical protein